ncbi:MAG: hybrid sensor histidine kinase/response regulator [Verrucomicrobiales bacterium]
MSLLSVWVLVGLFYYLNRYTKRAYFTIWTTAWLFYAVWLSLWIAGKSFNTPFLTMCKNWVVGASATFLIWGSCAFLKLKTPQRLFGSFLLFLLVWSYYEAYAYHGDFWVAAAMYIFMGGASLITAWAFYLVRKRRAYLGAGLLACGFFLWGCYLAFLPYLEQSEQLITSGFFISAVLQLFIAVSMIVLVLEEVKTTTETTLKSLETKTHETAVLRSKVISTEERYRSLFEQASEGIIIAEPQNLRILELNQTAKRLLGVNGDFSQHSFSAFCQLHSDKTPSEGDEWFELLKKQRIDLVRRDGSSVPAEVEASSINYDGSAAYQFFVREMTERTRLEQQLRQAEKLSALGQMISGIAHELNNPLAVVKGYVELVLNRHELAPNTRADLEKVAHESNRAAKLVQNFLTFAREQALEKTSLCINELIQRIVELRRFDFLVAGIDLRLNLEDDLPKTQGNPDQLQQVFVNLLHNSIQAMAKQPGQAILMITSQKVDEMIWVQVEDNGPGVSDTALPHIFEPFFTTKPVGTGTGLGLSIAHSILADHQGKISYQKSRLGGACFVLTVPITTAEEEEPEEEQVIRDLTDYPEESENTTVARILILDDEASIAELLGEMLQLLGHSPVLCNSPMHALEILKTQTFDLVLSDFRMPAMNGKQFYIEAIKIRPQLANRFIFLTGDVVTEDTQDFLQSSGNPHLPKPFQLKNVEKAVQKMLNDTTASSS